MPSRSRFAALRSELDLIGITTTHGNVGVAQTTANALAIANFLNLDVPVFAGSERALLREALPLYSDVKNGLGGYELPPHDRQTESRHAVAFLIDAVPADPGNVTITGIAPLTNIALAMRLEPRFAPAIEQIVIMGGAIHDLGTIAWLLRPEYFTLKPMTVRVDTNEGPNFGRTICDSRCRNSDVLPTVAERIAAY